jgi:hypothetical protein
MTWTKDYEVAVGKGRRRARARCGPDSQRLDRYLEL